jgi:hypothetical protein
MELASASRQALYSWKLVASWAIDSGPAGAAEGEAIYHSNLRANARVEG